MLDYIEEGEKKINSFIQNISVDVPVNICYSFTGNVTDIVSGIILKGSMPCESCYD